MENEITLKEKISYGIGAYGKDAACAMIFTYVMMYFTDVVKLSTAFVGAIFLIARLSDALINPVMGLIVDNTKSKYGKFRPWILAGTIINSVVFAFLFWNPQGHMSETAVYIFCGVAYILWSLTYTIMDIPYWSMIPAFSSDPAVRDQMSVIPRTFAMFGGQTISIFALTFISWLGVDMGGTVSDGWFRLTLCIIVVFIACEIITFLNVREHVVVKNQEKIGLKKAFLILGKNDQVLVIVCATLLQQISSFFAGGFMLYYFKYVMLNENFFQFYMAAGAVGMLIGYLTFPLLVRFTSRKTAYVISCTMPMVGYGSMFFVGTGPEAWLPAILVCQCIANWGFSLNMVSTTVMLADTVDYGEFKLGKRTDSIIFSMQTMTAIAGQALGGFVGGIALSALGYVPNMMQSPDTIFGLRVVICILAPIIMLIVMGIYLKFYKLNGDFYKKMLGILEVSRRENIK
jgi:melibiose permease